MKKHTTSKRTVCAGRALASVALITAGSLASSAEAATIVYNFNGVGLAGHTFGPTTLTAPMSSNDFGAGVTASVYSFAGGTASRSIGYIDETGVSDGGETRAMLQAGEDQTHSFVITISSDVTIDLTNLSWTSGTVFAEHSWELDINVGASAVFDTTGNPITTTEAGTRREVNNNVDLTGLTGLTDTTVTVTITDTTDRNNSSNTLYSFFDDVTLTGTAVAPVPEPSSAALLGIGGLALILRRRR